MKREVTFLLLISLLILLPLNVNKTYSLEDIEQEKFKLSTIDYSNWFWKGTEVISEEGSLASYSPNIAVDQEGNIHVTWDDYEPYDGSGSDKDVFYRMWNSTIESWSSIETVSTVSSDDSASSKIDVDTQNNVHIVWRDLEDYNGAGIDYDVFYRKKNIETNIWETTEVISTVGSAPSLDPDISVDQTNNVHIAWTDSADYNGSGTEKDIFYKEWREDSSSWSVIDVVSIGCDSVGGSEDSGICTDTEGNVFFVWSDYSDIDSAGTDQDIFFKYRTPSGSWSKIYVVSAMSDTTSQLPSIDCNNDGFVSIAWTDYKDYLDSGTDADIYYVGFSASNKLWSEIELVSTLSTSGAFVPSVAVDIFGNTHISYHDPTPLAGSGTDADIHYRRKDFDTKLWSILSVASGGDNDASSWTSSLTTDHKGYVHTVWYDQSDMLESGTDWDIFYNRLVGPPEKPILVPFTQNPDSLGDLSVDWSDCVGATDYDIYREEAFIWSLLGLTPIASVTTSDFLDTINETGTYYYSIVAKNDYGDSELSNVVSIVIDDDVSRFGFFEALRMGEILVLAGILGGFQIILSVATYFAVKAGSAPKKKKK